MIRGVHEPRFDCIFICTCWLYSHSKSFRVLKIVYNMATPTVYFFKHYKLESKMYVKAQFRAFV